MNLLLRALSASLCACLLSVAGSATERDLLVAGPVTADSTNIFQNLTVSASGYLTAQSGDVFVVNGDFLNGSTANVSWSTATAELSFQGGPVHQVTFAGADLQASFFGYTANFAFGTLRVGSGQSLVLGDGNATPGAAFYTQKLILAGGVAQIPLITGNGCNIYYDPTDAANAYLNAQTYPLAGGGAIIPVQAVLRIVSESRPVPGTLRLTCVGVPNRLNTIEASPNLATGTFAAIGSIAVDATGNFTFDDQNAGSFAKRFYRVRFP